MTHEKTERCSNRLALGSDCSIATPTDASLSYGTIRSSCAPTDAPAIAITLTPERSACKLTQRSLCIVR